VSAVIGLGLFKGSSALAPAKLMIVLSIVVMHGISNYCGAGKSLPRVANHVRVVALGVLSLRAFPNQFPGS
jgi:hypothetical protein